MPTNKAKTTKYDDDDDLLTRLAPGGAENFITEVFCWLLDKTDFGNEFLDRLMEIDEKTRKLRGDDCTWETQTSHELDGTGTHRRPDMVCKFEDENTALIFEHKIRADLRDSQLDDYWRIGENEFPNKFRLILITAIKSQRSDQKPNRHLLWEDVYQWLSEWCETETDNVERFVARSFLALLEERGLGPMKKITDEQLRAIPSAYVVKQQIKQGVQQIKSLVNRAAEKFSLPENLVKEAGLDKQDPKPWCQAWGRYGWYLLAEHDANTWKPGLFVGVLHHARNHRPKSVDDLCGSGPVACVIVCVHDDFHDLYKNSESYQSLVGALKHQWPEDAAPDDRRAHGWRVNTEKEQNLCQPLIIYKPLVTVFQFQGASTGDKQVERLVEDLRYVAETVLGLEEFQEFRKLFN